MKPELAPIVHLVNGEPFTLFWGQWPLALALHICHIIHELCTQLESDQCLFQLNDGTLGGSLQEVLRDLQLVEQGCH